MKLIGVGHTAEAYEYEEGKICKLFFDWNTEEAINRECHNAMIMQKYVLAVPRCYGIIEVEGRKGIVYEQIKGKTLIEKYFEDGDGAFMLDTLVDVHKGILACQTKEVMSYKDFCIMLIKYGSYTKGLEVNEDEIQKVEALPDGDCLCHGDYHILNIMVGEDKKPYVIDFMNVCYGPREYDIARSYYLLKYGEVPEDVPNREEIINMQGELGENYLIKMNVTYEELEKYIEVVKICRGYE